MAAPAFGFSVGDFISAIQLVIQITDALRTTSTVDTDCQEAVAFLGIVQHTLRRVYDFPVANAEAEAFEQVRVCANLCSKRVVSTLQRFKKVELILTAPTPSSVSKAAGLRARLKRNTMKVKWSLTMKDELSGLQKDITPQIVTMQIYLQFVEHHNASHMRRQQALVLETGRNNQIQLQRLVEHMETRLGAQREDVSFQPGGTALLAHTPHQQKAPLREQPLVHPSMDDLTKGVESFVMMLALVFWRLLSRISLAMSTVTYGPSMLLDNNIIVSDALGRTLSLPYEHFNDWTMITARLKVAFRGCAGESNVKYGNFGLFLLRGRGEMLHATSWRRQVTPGSKVVMAMFIEAQGFARDQCPRCGSASNTIEALGWATCGACELRHKLSQEEPLDAGVDTTFHAASLEENSNLGERISPMELDRRIAEGERDVHSFRYVHWATSQCLYCDAVFTSGKALSDHERSSHRDERMAELHGSIC